MSLLDSEADKIKRSVDNMIQPTDSVYKDDIKRDAAVKVRNKRRLKLILYPHAGLNHLFM